MNKVGLVLQGGAIRASSSLPFVSKRVSLDGLELFDGGVTDPIPIKKSIEDGNDKNIVVLTSKIVYQRKSRLVPLMAKRIYPEYSELTKALCDGHDLFNQTLDFIEELRKDEKVCII